MGSEEVVQLTKEGAILLPHAIREGLPAGTQFVIQRQEQTIVLRALSDEENRFDLSPTASGFANELTSEGFDDEYTIQMALTLGEQANRS